MSPVLATVPEDAARKVAADIRDHGHGYIRVDREGRAEHVPAYAVVEALAVERGERRMHE